MVISGIKLTSLQLSDEHQQESVLQASEMEDTDFKAPLISGLFAKTISSRLRMLTLS